MVVRGVNDRYIDDVLCRQFERLSQIEQQLVDWLAIEHEPFTGVELRSNDRDLGSPAGKMCQNYSHNA